MVCSVEELNPQIGVAIADREILVGNEIDRHEGRERGAVRLTDVHVACIEHGARSTEYGKPKRHSITGDTTTWRGRLDVPHA